MKKKSWKVTRRARRLSWIVGITSITLLSLSCAALRMDFTKMDKKLVNKFKKKEVAVQVFRSTFGGNTMRYLRAGKADSQIALVWIHGAPGSLDMFSNVLSDSVLQENFNMFSVDRLGYGGSRNDSSFPSIKEQAKSIHHILKQIPQKEIWLFGHSFGAPIAGKVAHINKKVTHLFLAGGAVDPDLEKFEGLARFVNLPLIRGISSKDTRVATDEKLNHKEELEKIETIWRELDCKVISIHGTKDWLVPYENQAFLRERVKPNNFTDKTLEGRNHFFFSDADLLREIVMEFYPK